VKILTVTKGSRHLSFQERSQKRYIEVGAMFPDFVWVRLGVNGLPRSLYLSRRPVRAEWVHPTGRYEVIVTPKPGQSLASFVFTVVDEFFHAVQHPADSTPGTTITG